MAEVQDQTLLSLERDLLEIEAECGRSNELSVFLAEYRSLFEQMRKSEESVGRINSNNRQLQAEIMANDAKLPFAKRIMTDSDTNMINLKKDVENTLTEVLKAQSAEKEKKTQLKDLQNEIQNLGVQLDYNMVGVHNKQPKLEKLLFEKCEMSGSLNEELEQVSQLRDALQGSVEEHQQIDEQRSQLRNNNELLTNELQVKEADVVSLENRRDLLRESLETGERKIAETDGDIGEKRNMLKDYQLNIERIRRQNNEQKIGKEKVAYEIDVLAAKYLNLQDTCKAQYKKLDDFTADTKLKTEDVKNTETEAENYRKQIEKVNKVCEMLSSKIDSAEKQKIELDHEKRSIKEKQLALEAGQASHNKLIQIGKREIKKVQVEDRRIKKDKATEQQRTKDKVMKLEKCELNQKLLNEQIEEHKIVYNTQFHENEKTDKQRMDYMKKAMQFQDTYLKVLEKDKEMEDAIVGYKKDFLSQENQEKCLKNMCEAVRNDINLANRTMLELRTDMTEMKQDMQTKLTEVDQLKTEVDRLTGLVRSEEKDAKFIEDFNRNLKTQITQEEELNKVTKQTCLNQNEDYLRMIKTMGEIQFEKTKQDGELQKIITERNLLDKQIINRNIELKDLYEKLKLQTSVLYKGERNYVELETRAEGLKQQVKQLFQQKLMLKKKGDGATSLRDQIESTRRELTRNRHACRVLEEEVEIPVNVHRWRSLQGSDPSTYALIEKLQSINQRYLKVCGELSEKQMVLQLKEKMYIDMKHAITKQPGPEVSEQLTVYQSVLKEKAKQLKGMKDECRLFESQEAEYKSEIQSLIKEIAQVKKKFFLQVEIDEKNAKLGRKAADVKNNSGAQRPRTTTPRDLSPRDGGQEPKSNRGVSGTNKEVKFTDDTQDLEEGVDGATGKEEGETVGAEEESGDATNPAEDTGADPGEKQPEETAGDSEGPAQNVDGTENAPGETAPDETAPGEPAPASGETEGVKDGEDRNVESKAEDVEDGTTVLESTVNETS